MKWLVKRKGSVYRKHRRLDVDDWLVIGITVFITCFVAIQFLLWM